MASLLVQPFRDLEAAFGKTADELLDKVTMALQDYDTETLLGIADYRQAVHPEGWMQRLIWQYVEVWRG